MRAYEIGPVFGQDQLRLVERSQPEPGPGEVLVRVHACSLNYRDLLVIDGSYNPRLPLPRVPGSDASGVVAACGPGVTRVRPGDRVMGCLLQSWIDGPLTADAARSALGGQLDGVLAEYVVWREQGVVLVPAGLGDAQAATLPCAAVTAWHGVIERGLRPGEHVLVLGTGGVSLFALQFAKLAGARVLITSSSDDKLARARALGADECINYRTNPEWDRAVRDITGGEGVDQVVEVGGAGTMARSIRAVRHGGRISLVGVLAGGASEFNPLPAMMKEVDIQGIFVGSRAIFERMLRAVTCHALQPVIDRSFEFEDLPAALDMLRSGSHFGKIVIELVS